MSAPLEILVHVSGPGRGADDARYRREALGLLNFHPATRFSLAGDHVDANVTDNLPLGATQRAFAVRDLFEAKLQALTPSRDAITEITKDSAPTRTLIKETPRLLVDQTPGLPRPRTAPSIQTPSQTIPPLRRTQSDSWQTPPSVVPDSQDRALSSAGVQIANSPCLKRPFQSSSPSPTRRSSPLAKRPKFEPVATKGAPPSSSPAAAATLLQKGVSLPFDTAYPLEIHPPRAPVGSNTFTTHVTPDLKNLSEILPLVDYFKPLVVKRELDDTERGHWHILVGTWDNTVKVKFWQFLNDFITAGRAGWAVRCFRERLDGHSDNHAQAHDIKESKVVKVYCWGEVIGEVYLLLWLASDRKVQSIGARWLDGGGEVVVQMR